MWRATHLNIESPVELRSNDVSEVQLISGILG